MPSIVFDAHTLCIGCEDQVCNMSVHCYECRDWSDSYRLAFLITTLLRLGVIRQCGVRLGLVLRSLSDQSVCDTDTDVRSINEPIPSVQVQSDKVECVCPGSLRGG